MLKKVNFRLVSGKEGGKVLMARVSGKAAFIDRSYQGIKPADGENWAVQVTSDKEKVCFVWPKFKIDPNTSLQNLQQIEGVHLKLDCKASEFLVFSENEELLSCVPYDHSWDEKILYFSAVNCRLGELLELHQHPPNTIMLISSEKIVRLSEEIEKGDRDLKNYHQPILISIEEDITPYTFADERTREKWEEMQKSLSLEFYSLQNEPLPARFHNNAGMARAIGMEVISIDFPLSQNISDSSYIEIIREERTEKRGRLCIVIPAGTICNSCGKEITEEAFDLQCPFCGIGERLHPHLGNSNQVDIRLDYGCSKLKWETTEERLLTFPFENEILKGELRLMTNLFTHKAFLQTLQKWEVKKATFVIKLLKRKSMLPKVIIPIQSINSWGDKEVKRLEAEIIVASEDIFPPNFSENEKFVGGWLPITHFHQTIPISAANLHQRICEFIAFIGNYTPDDVPQSFSGVKDTIKEMMEDKELDFMPDDGTIKALYSFFKRDWKSFGQAASDFPSQGKWEMA